MKLMFQTRKGISWQAEKMLASRKGHRRVESLVLDAEMKNDPCGNYRYMSRKYFAIHIFHL